MQARAVPGRGVRGAGYDLEVHGLPVERRGHRQPLPIHDVDPRSPAMPGFLKGHEGPDLPAEARAIGATVDGVRLWSLYVPNGRELGDPHYTYKLDWLAALSDHTRAAPPHPTCSSPLMGDLNVAPFDMDVGDPSVFVGATHVSAAERDAFRAFESRGQPDVVRPSPRGPFTYWDYKQLRFPRNEGMRIDFVLAPGLRRRRHRRVDPPRRAQGRRPERSRPRARRPRPR